MRTDGAQLLLQLRELLLTHCSFVISILLLNPDDLLHKMRVVNMETLELSDTPEQVRVSAAPHGLVARCVAGRLTWEQVMQEFWGTPQDTQQAVG